MKPRRPTEKRIIRRMERAEARTRVVNLFGFRPRRAQIEYWLANPKKIEALKVVLGA